MDDLTSGQAPVPGWFPPGVRMPVGVRLRAWLYGLFADHGAVRLFWKNRWQVAPGVWRMNQPAHHDLARLRREGVRTVINLRGESARPFRQLEARSCHRLGLTLVNLRLHAKTVPSRETLLALLDSFEAAELPLVMHCKSGADRTGMAAALWRLVMAGGDAATAAQQLSLRYGHSPRGAAGVQGQILRAYAEEGESVGLSFRCWVETRYDPASIEAAFARWRAASG